MCSDRSDWALPQPGLPIRTSPGQRLLDNSPGHIAACHVLHRLRTPRHPPLALSSLIDIEYFDFNSYSLCSSQRARAGFTGTLGVSVRKLQPVGCASEPALPSDARARVSARKLAPDAKHRTPSRLNSVSDPIQRSGPPVRSHPRVQPSGRPALCAGPNNQ